MVSYVEKITVPTTNSAPTAMLKSISMGKYIEGNSLLHRVNPQSKLFVVIVYFAVLLMVPVHTGILVYAVGMLAAITVAGIPLKRSLQGIRPLVMLSLVALVTNALFTRGTALAENGALQYISQEGCIRSLTMLVRLLVVAWLAALLTATTQTRVLINSVTIILAKLEKIKIPVTDTIQILSLTMGLLPAVASKAESFFANRPRLLGPEGLSMHARLDEYIRELSVLFTELYAFGKELIFTLEAEPQPAELYEKKGGGTALGGDDFLFTVVALSYLALMTAVALRI